jgi:hypothetical protein
VLTAIDVLTWLVAGMAGGMLVTGIVLAVLAWRLQWNRPASFVTLPCLAALVGAASLLLRFPLHRAVVS